MTYGWVSPVMRKGWWWVEITEPESLHGCTVVAVDAEMCLEPNGPHVCGLVRNHRGDHWLCSRELAEEAGPFAIAKPAATGDTTPTNTPQHTP